MRSKIDRDDDLGAHGATERNGDGVHNAAVDQVPTVVQHWPEQSGHGTRSADGIGNLALAQPKLFSRRQIGSDRCKREWQLRKLAFDKLTLKHVEQAVAFDQAAPKSKVELKDPSQFRYIGTGKMKLVDAQDIATGKSQYGMDTRVPGMVYAVVARPQVYGGKVVSVDSAAALKVPGVLRVVQIDPTPGAPQFNPLGGVAVIGRNTWAAMQGRAALKIVWDDGPNATYDSAAYRATLEEAARKPGKVVRNDGDFAAASAAAAKRITAEYYLPHLAHASMEPPAASARIVNGKCDVWGCFQSPQAARTWSPSARHAGRKRHRPRHAAWRRIRTQVQARLRHRGGGAVEGDGRQAGESRVDARRRSAQRLFPHRVIEQPETKSGAMPFSVSARSTPICAHPRAEPLPSAIPSLGRWIIAFRRTLPVDAGENSLGMQALEPGESEAN